MSKGATIKKRIGKHKELILLFSIPLAILVIALIAMLASRLLMQPEYDFIYASCESYACTDRYIVNNGQLEREFANDTAHRPTDLYLYNVEDDSSRRISLDEAEEYRLDGSSRAPDGYELTYESSGGSSFLLLHHSGNSGWQLQKGWASRFISIDGSRWNVEKIGWVIE